MADNNASLDLSLVYPRFGADLIEYRASLIKKGTPVDQADTIMLEVRDQMVGMYHAFEPARAKARELRAIHDSLSK